MRIAISTVWACLGVSCLAGQSGTNESAIPFGGQTGEAPKQYFTPGIWAAVTNGLSLSQLRDLAASPQSQASRGLAARLAASAGLPPSAIPAISAAAAEVLAAETPSAGSPQPLTAMSGSTLVNTHILNLDFGGSMSSPETGPAAAGVAQNNYWNYLGNQVPGPIWCLTKPDGQTLTPVSLTASGFSGSWSDGSTEPMYADYIYPPYLISGTLTLNNLPAGTCNVYAYSFDGNFQLALGNNNLGTRTTAFNYPAVNPPPWVRGLHYALWQNVTIVPAQPLVLTVSPGTQGYAVISGMQISYTQPYQYPMQPGTAAWVSATPQQRLAAEAVPASFYTTASSDQLFNTVLTNPKFRSWGWTSSSTYLAGYQLAKHANWGKGLIPSMENSASLGTAILNWLLSLNLNTVDANNGLQFGNYATPCDADLESVYYMASLAPALQTGNPASLFKLAAWDANHYVGMGLNTMAAAPTWVIYTIYNNQSTYKNAVPPGITLPALSNDDSRLLQMGVFPNDLAQAISGLPSALGLSSRPTH